MGLDDEGWRDWVRRDAEKQAQLLENPVQDKRSPQDIFEDIVPELRYVDEINGPVYDMVGMAQGHEYGPFSTKTVLPEILHVRPKCVLCRACLHATETQRVQTSCVSGLRGGQSCGVTEFRRAGPNTSAAPCRRGGAGEGSERGGAA